MEQKTEKSKTKNLLILVLKLVITLAAAGAVFIAGTLIGFLLAAEDIHLWITYLVGYLPLALLLPLIWVKGKKKYLKLWLAAAVLCAAILGADFALVKHNASIRVNTSDYRYLFENAYDYQPFEEDSLIVKADSKTLELTENLPRIDGATALLPVYSAFVHAVYPDTVELSDGILENTSGSAVEYLSEWGYRGLANNESDVFFDLYPIGDAEVYAGPYGAAFEYTTIGTEALVFFVHHDNPIDSLTVQQIRDIYSGGVTNWKDLGGKSGKIAAYQCQPGSCGQKMLERFMGITPLMAPPTEMGYDSLFDYVEMISHFKNKAGSIGFGPRYLVEGNPDIKVLSVDGAAPTVENIKNGSYSPVFPIYAVTCQGNTNDNIGRLFDWILSEEGQYILEESGYTGVAADYPY